MACNQKSNRDPVMELDEATVHHHLNTLRDKRLACQLETVGSRVPKFAHRLLGFWPDLTPPQVAILATLLLRGPQTIGELRMRGERFYKFTSTAELETTVQSLINPPAPIPAAPVQEPAAAAEPPPVFEPLIVKLPRAAGQKECRYAHLFCGAVTSDEKAEPATPSPEMEKIGTLEQEIAKLRGEVQELKASFEAFVKQFS